VYRLDEASQSRISRNAISSSPLFHSPLSTHSHRFFNNLKSTQKWPSGTMTRHYSRYSGSKFPVLSLTLKPRSKKNLREYAWTRFKGILISKIKKNVSYIRRKTFSSKYIIGFLDGSKLIKTKIVIRKYVKYIGWTGYANYNLLFVKRLSHRYRKPQKKLFDFIVIGVFFWQFSEKPNFHLFTKNLMLPKKQNYVLG
jgi:hypothetical protein